MAERNVVIQLIAKTGRFTGPMAAAGAQTKALSGTMGGLDASTAKLGKSSGITAGKLKLLGGAAVGIAAVGVVAIGAIGIAAVSAFAAFDAKMTESLAIMGDVSDVMKEDMALAAREVGKTTKFSAGEAAESFFFLASAGLNAAESIEALPQVAAFAQAGMFDMARATDLATDAQSALGLVVKGSPVRNLKNLTRVTDVLVKANTLANASVEQFSEALTNKAGASLRALGKDMEEGVAVLAAYADQGLKGVSAGDALSRVLRDLQRAALGNSEAFETAGIAVFDSAGEMNNMGDIIAQLEDRLAGMSDAQKKAELGALGFQEKAQAMIITLLGTSDSIKEYEAALREAGGTTQEVADKQLDTLSAQMGLLKSKIADAGLELGKNLEPAFRDMLPAIESLIDSFISFAETAAPIIVESFKLIASFAEVLATGLLSIRSLFDEDAKAALRSEEAFKGVAKALEEGDDSAVAFANGLLHMAENGALTAKRIKALGEEAELTGEKEAVAIAQVLEYARANDLAADDIKLLEDALIAQILVLRETDEEVISTAEAYGLGEEAARALTVQSEELAIEEARVAEETAKATEETEAAVAAQEAVVAAEEEHVAALETLAGSIRIARDEQQSLTDAVLRFTNPAFNAAKAIEGVGKAEEKLTELAKDGKKGTDEYKLAMLDLAKANLEAQASLDALDASGIIDAVDGIALALDISQEEALELLEALGLIDGTTIETVVDVSARFSGPSIGQLLRGSGGFSDPKPTTTTRTPSIGELLRGTGGAEHGGPLRAGQPSLVGERGVELFVPSTAGTVISNTNINVTRQGPTVNIDRPESFDLPQDIATGLIMGGIVEAVEGGVLERGVV